MSEEEVICEWMEPRPDVVDDGADPNACYKWPHRWWKWYRDRNGHLPRELDLNALHEVEARLSDKQWLDYRREFRLVVERVNGTWPLGQRSKDMLHATAEQKIRALASVLRGAAHE